MLLYKLNTPAEGIVIVAKDMLYRINYLRRERMFERFNNFRPFLVLFVQNVYNRQEV